MRDRRITRSLNSGSAPRRCQLRIGQECIHGGQASGVTVPHEVAHLHRRRLPRKRQQPIARSVPCQIDQNIDAVVPDPLCQIRVAQTDRAAPMIGEGMKPLGDRVLGWDLGIAVQLDGRAIMRRQERLCEQRDGVLAEIR